MHRFPSEGWTQAYKEALNRCPAYRRAGRQWIFGSVAIVVQGDPSVGIEDDTGMILDVHAGQCLGAKLVNGIHEALKAEFVITATYERWKDVIQGRLDPIKGMMQGKLRLSKGHLPTVIRFVESCRQLVASAAKVPTEFDS